MTAADKLQQAMALYGEAQEKINTLRNVDPFFIELSLRENPVGAPVGQTLENKLAILPLIRESGFEHILLGTLDYAIPDELEVDDDFMRHMKEHDMDMTGCYVFTAIGLENEQGVFTPDPSMLKMQAYGVSNSLHEICLSDRGMRGQYDIDTLKRSLPASINWMMDNIRGDNGNPPKLFINIVDGCDAFENHPERTCEMLDLISRLPVEGISIEDDRGTFLPFQVGTFIAMARTFLPPPFKILAHLHTGGGFENAAALEALLSGADGIWGALPKQAALIGHASLGELLANLARLGNQTVASKYQLDQLLPRVRHLQTLDGVENIPDNTPVLGSNAYRVTLSFFEQIHGYPMDLPADRLGATTGYRIAPVVSDPPVIAGRLAEITGSPPDNFSATVLENMIRLMRQDLRAGLRIIYDEPANLLELYDRAKLMEQTLNDQTIMDTN